MRSLWFSHSDVDLGGGTPTRGRFGGRVPRASGFAVSRARRQWQVCGAVLMMMVRGSRRAGECQARLTRTNNGLGNGGGKGGVGSVQSCSGPVEKTTAVAGALRGFGDGRGRLRAGVPVSLGVRCGGGQGEIGRRAVRCSRGRGRSRVQLRGRRGSTTALALMLMRLGCLGEEIDVVRVTMRQGGHLTGTRDQGGEEVQKARR